MIINLVAQGAEHGSALVAAAPIILLIWLMTKSNPMNSYKALPLTAGIMYLLKLTYFNCQPDIVHAAVINGLLSAWTPVFIVAGAIMLFHTMEHSGNLNVIRKWLNGITTNKIAQLMIIGWAFSFLIEGVSGFGTPAALAAPILLGMGFPAVRVAILCLIMNSVPVSFGAVGTPTWFGLSNVDANIAVIGRNSALIHLAASLVIPLIALSFVESWKTIRKNIIFIYCSILACMIPYVIMAFFSYEFPAIIGGFTGIVVSVMLAKKSIGLEKTEHKIPANEKVHARQLLYSSFPIWATVLVLLITRIKQLPFKAMLTSDSHYWSAKLGTLGQLRISSSLVVSLQDIFGVTKADGGTWSHKLLYVPSIIPFVLVSLIAWRLFKMDRGKITLTCSQTYSQVKNAAIALMGALVLVKLLMSGGEQACTKIMGNSMADIFGSNWKYAASYLGALGSFFSGSNTISNLTFGGIQEQLAVNIGQPKELILSLQSVGGAMGNMVCINNIIAVCSVLGLKDREGYILKRTVIPMLIYGLIAAIMAIML
ncbi:MAG: L-lactate permease [Phycisphaerae bacterium]|nr:L-lactate permease [Phycisphaerae bacterium]